MASAIFSDCRTWRYTLHREVGRGSRTVAFIGLNPSTADETKDDPTIRRCIGFARSWGFGRMTVLNLYAIRSTDPRGIWSAADPIGPDNDHHLRVQGAIAELVVASWGAFPLASGRAGTVAALLHDLHQLHVLALSKHGHPRHPLYLRKDLRPVPWRVTP